MSNYTDDGPYTKHGTTCKFCRKPITVEIAVSYAEIGDPLKIIPLAACDRCSDLREERRKLESKIRVVSMTYAAMGGSKSKEIASRYMGIFEKVLMDYANMIARWHFMDGKCWDDVAVQTIMEHPEAWPKVVQTLWVIFKDANKSRKGVGV